MATIVILKPGDVCSFEGCKEPATGVAYGRERLVFSEDTGHPKPAVYCEDHADVIDDEGNPEFGAQCQNCGCSFGVN